VTEYGVPHDKADIVALVPVTVAAGEPFRETRYPVTATSSVDPVQESEMLSAVWPVTLRPVGAVGGWESPHRVVWTQTEVLAE
jgi:hypothetical protein